MASLAEMIGRQPEKLRRIVPTYPARHYEFGEGGFQAWAFLPGGGLIHTDWLPTRNDSDAALDLKAVGPSNGR